MPRVRLAFGLQGELLAKGYKATHINFESGDHTQETFKIVGIYQAKNTWTKTGLSFKKGTNYAFYGTTDSMFKKIGQFEFRGKNSSGKTTYFKSMYLFGILFRSTWIADGDYTDIEYKCGTTSSDYNMYIEEGKNIPVEYTITVNEDNYTKVMAIMNGYVDDNVISKNRFIYPFFVRYALRMYSGDYLYTSTPILMIPNSGYAPLVTYKQNKAADEIFAYAFVADLQYSVIESLPEDWKDLISGVDIFVSQQMYCYRQGQEYDAGKEDLFTYAAYDATGTTKVDSVTGTSYGYMNLSQFGVNDPTGGRYEKVDLAKTLLDSTSLSFFDVVKPVPKTDIEERICNEGSFYLFKSLDFDDIKEASGEASPEKNGNYTYNTREMKTLEATEGTLSNLVTRRTLTDDILSNRTIMSGLMHAYNNRLHIHSANVKLGDPVPPQEQVGFLSCKYDSSIKDLTKIASLRSVYVYLHTDDGDKIVGYHDDDASSVFGRIIDHDGVCWFFYPDNQAYKAEFIFKPDGIVTDTTASKSETETTTDDDIITDIETEGGTVEPDGGTTDTEDGTTTGGDTDTSTTTQNTTYKKVTITLKQHEVLNGSYWYAGSMSGLSLFEGMVAEDIDKDQEPVDDEIVSKPHTIYVSEVNNPFVFYSKNTVNIGCSSIYKLSSAAKALSSGQFGQYPLYAFCDNGVWAMETSTEGVYVARQPITRDVCNNKENITQVDAGVVFSTDKGLMYLCGSDVTCLSDAIFGRNADALKLPRLEIIGKNVSCGTDVLMLDGNIIDFANFLLGSRVAYDYSNNRLIVHSEGVFFGYVYSFTSGSWGTIETTLLHTPINSYPDALFLGHDEDGNSCIYNLSKRGFDGKQGCFAITRPFSISTDTFKTINELAVRGAFEKGSVRLLLYGSNDGRKWHIVSSSKTNKLQGYSGSPYKRFVLAVMLDLEYADYIWGQTVDFMERMNDKLR